jgi:hypothetical protein
MKTISFIPQIVPGEALKAFLAFPRLRWRGLSVLQATKQNSRSDIFSQGFGWGRSDLIGLSDIRKSVNDNRVADITCLRNVRFFIFSDIVRCRGKLVVTKDLPE